MTVREVVMESNSPCLLLQHRHLAQQGAELAGRALAGGGGSPAVALAPRCDCHVSASCARQLP